MIAVNVAMLPAARGSLVNTAACNSAADTTGVSSTVTTTVDASADLVLDVTSTPTVNAGETVIVTYTVTNLGPSTAADAVITATFPASVTAPAGWTLVGGNVYTYAVGSVPAGATVVVTAVVTASSTLEPGTSLEFGGSAGSSTRDPNPTNNTANADTSVIANADLDVSKTATPTTVIAGELVTYTIVVTNLGPSFASFVDSRTRCAGVTQVGGRRFRSKGATPCVQRRDLPGDTRRER